MNVSQVGSVSRLLVLGMGTPATQLHLLPS